MRKLRKLAPFCLILQPVVFYWSVLVSRSAHIPYDLEAYHYPTLAYLAACVREGQWPWWDPYTYTGMPLHADPQAQMFYPPAWVAMALGNLTAGRDLFYCVEWLIAAHMILGGVFTWMLLRRMGVRTSAAMLGATVYQLGGFFASQACHLGAVSAGAWLPLALVALSDLKERFSARSFAVLAAALALSILAGYAATTLVVAGSVVLYCVAFVPWRRYPAVAGAFILAGLISAVQIVPTIRLTGLSIASLRSDWLTEWGAPLESLVSLALPDYYHIFELSKYQLHQNFTLLYCYCGILTLVLLLAAPFVRRARVFGALTLAALLWMLGEHTPFYPAVFALLPQLIRGASYAWYAMMAFCLFAGITAALAMDSLGRRVPAAALWAIAVFTSFDLLYAGRNRPMNTAPGGYSLVSSEYQYGRSPEDLRKLREMVDVATPPLRFDYANLWSPGVIMGGMLRLPTADGNIPFMLRRIYLVRKIFCATQPNARDLAIAGAESPIFRRNLPVEHLDSPLVRMLNTGFVASTDRIPEATEAVAGLSIVLIDNPMPRFYLTPSVRASSGSEETFRWLGNPGFRPREGSIVEGGIQSRQGLGAGTVHVVTYAPDRVELEVDSTGPGFMASSEAWYPGWEATVNKQAQRLWMTNGAFRGLAVPQGKSGVVLTYHPVDLVWSALVSLAASAVTLGCALIRRKPANNTTGTRISQND